MNWHVNTEQHESYIPTDQQPWLVKTFVLTNGLKRSLAMICKTIAREIGEDPVFVKYGNSGCAAFSQRVYAELRRRYEAKELPKYTYEHMRFWAEHKPHHDILDRKLAEVKRQYDAGTLPAAVVFYLHTVAEKYRFTAGATSRIGSRALDMYLETL